MRVIGTMHRMTIVNFHGKNFIIINTTLFINSSTISDSFNRLGEQIMRVVGNFPFGLPDPLGSSVKKHH